MSARASSAAPACICSGAMYSGVPRIPREAGPLPEVNPERLWLIIFAKPKSPTFTTSSPEIEPSCFSFLQIFIREHVGPDRFHRHATRHQILIARQIHLAHRAAPQTLLQMITAVQQCRAGQSVLGL